MVGGVQESVLEEMTPQLSFEECWQGDLEEPQQWPSDTWGMQVFGMSGGGVAVQKESKHGKGVAGGQHSSQAIGEE